MKPRNSSPVAGSDAFSIGQLDAHDQAALLHSGELSAQELVQAAIARIEALDPALNAVTCRAYEEALRQARALTNPTGMAGVPYLLKDGLDYQGLPSLCGSRSKLHSPNASRGDEFTRRLDAAGVIVLGKTNVPEYGLLPTTESVLYGPARNPWNLQHSPGGSSGGAAVAVASGMVPVAHAADGGGSIRIPAACCGVFGLKPSRGANVRARGPHLIEDLLVGDALLSRSVRDAAWAYATTHPRQNTPPQPQTNPRLRIGLVMNNFAGALPDPAVAGVIEKSAKLCAGLGHHVEEVALPFDGPGVDACFRTIWAYLAQDIVSQCRASLRSGHVEGVLEPWTLNLALCSGKLTPRDLEAVFEQVVSASARLDAFFSRYDVLLSPVLRYPPVPLGKLAPTQPFEILVHDMFDYVSYTPLQNLTGTPAMSVPLFATDAGLPIGTMFAAARDHDALLLQLAYELEQAQPWAARWPSHSVATI